MSHWNHRVIKHTTEQEVLYGIHEVFYNDDNSIYAYTEEPVRVYAESIEELREYMQWMMNCLDKEVLVDGEVEFVESNMIEDDNLYWDRKINTVDDIYKGDGINTCKWCGDTGMMHTFSNDGYFYNDAPCICSLGVEKLKHE